MKRFLVGLAAITAALLTASVVLADNLSQDNDIVTPGNQSSVNLGTVAPGAALNTSAQLVIEYQGSKHLSQGTSATVILNATTLPSGYSVGDAVFSVPNDWGTTTRITQNSAISFTAPATPGPYSYTVSWTAGFHSCASSPCLSGNTNLFTINLTVAAPPTDTTPPVITPNVSGTLGSNGWYVSDVTVSWTVSDPESTITSTSGCGSTTINSDTTGTTLTCTATSAGGTSSQSVTIKRDATDPTISGSASPAANGNGWNNTNVTITFTCNDATSGIFSCTAPVMLSSEGAGQSANGTAVDNAGNSANTTVSGINIDKTAPSISYDGQSPAANGSGWNNTDVTLTWSCSDSLSGVVSATVQKTVTTEGANQSETATCYDKAGNSKSDTQSVSIDKTAPVVTLNGPVNGATYTVGGVPALSCDTQDALSGVQTNATGATTGPASGVGSFTATCSGALDNADNAGNTPSVTYTVQYGICLLFDNSKAKKTGSTIPVKLQICDASGNNLSASGIKVTAYGLTKVSDVPPSIEVDDEDSGNANPDSNFRYSADLQGYIYNLSTKNLTSGDWWLWFKVQGDDTWHAVSIKLVK